jgi:hypothetical protein
MVQKGKHGLRLDIIYAQIRHGLGSASEEKSEEEFQRVPVSSNGVIANSMHTTEIVVEEALDQGQKDVSFFSDQGSTLLGRLRYRRRNLIPASAKTGVQSTLRCASHFPCKRTLQQLGDGPARWSGWFPRHS